MCDSFITALLMYKHIITQMKLNVCHVKLNACHVMNHLMHSAVNPTLSVAKNSKKEEYSEVAFTRFQVIRFYLGTVSCLLTKKVIHTPNLPKQEIKLRTCTRYIPAVESCKRHFTVVRPTFFREKSTF